MTYAARVRIVGLVLVALLAFAMGGCKKSAARASVDASASASAPVLVGPPVPLPSYVHYRDRLGRYELDVPFDVSTIEESDCQRTGCAVVTRFATKEMKIRLWGLEPGVPATLEADLARGVPAGARLTGQKALAQGYWLSFTSRREPSMLTSGLAQHHVFRQTAASFAGGVRMEILTLLSNKEAMDPVILHISSSFVAMTTRPAHDCRRLVWREDGAGGSLELTGLLTTIDQPVEGGTIKVQMLTVAPPLCDRQGNAAWEIQVHSQQDLRPFAGKRITASADLERPTDDDYRPIVANLTAVR